MGFIEEFYRGNVVPIENLGFSDNPEYKALLKEVLSKEDDLMDSLSKEQKVSFQQIKSIREEINSLESVRLFELAFRTASRLVIDIYEDK